MARAGYGSEQVNPGLLLVDKIYSYIQVGCRFCEAAFRTSPAVASAVYTVPALLCSPKLPLTVALEASAAAPQAWLAVARRQARHPHS